MKIPSKQAIVEIASISGSQDILYSYGSVHAYGPIWAAARRWNLIVSFANSEQFIIIVLLIRPFPEEIYTKSLLSLLVIQGHPSELIKSIKL